MGKRMVANRGGLRVLGMLAALALGLGACSDGGAEQATDAADATDAGTYGKAPAPSSADPAAAEPDVPQTAVPVHPEGGTARDPSRTVRVDVPAGGVASETALTLVRVDADAWDDATAGLDPVAVYDVGPEDTPLQAPVRVSFTLPTAELEMTSSGQAAGLVPLRRAADASWQLLEGVGVEVRDAQTVVAADTNELGRFAVVQVKVRSVNYGLEHDAFGAANAKLSATVQLTDVLFSTQRTVNPAGPWVLRATLGLAGGESQQATAPVEPNGVATLEFGIDYFGTYHLEQAELIAPTGQVHVLKVEHLDPVEVTA
ncbi:MAG TPA: hypothetical protein VGA69_04880 [Nitriliruptorales bacterium]